MVRCHIVVLQCSWAPALQGGRTRGGTGKDFHPRNRALISDPSAHLNVLDACHWHEHTTKPPQVPCCKIRRKNTWSPIVLGRPHLVGGRSTRNLTDGHSSDAPMFSSCKSQPSLCLFSAHLASLPQLGSPLLGFTRGSTELDSWITVQQIETGPVSHSNYG
jgi:hypothetical protein